MFPAKHLTLRHERFRDRLNCSIHYYYVVIVVISGQSAECGDVGGSHPQDGQFRQPLTVREGGYRPAERLEGGADGVHSGSLPGVRLHPPLFRHILVVPASGMGGRRSSAVIGTVTS